VARIAAGRPLLPSRRAVWRGAVLLLAFLLVAAAPVTTPLPAPTSPASPPVTIAGEVDATRLTLGDTVTLTVQIDHAPAVEVVFPDPTLALPDGVEQRGFARTTAAGPDGRTVERLIWQLRCWQLGRFTLPAVAVTYLAADRTEKRAATRAIDIEVISVRTSKNEGPRPMTDPVSLPVNWRLWAMVAGLATLSAAGLVAGIAAWRRRPRKEVAPPPPPPADRVALDALVRLAHSDALTEGDAARVATRLSAITRHYLEHRLRFPALESTTREVDQWLTGCAEVDEPLRATLLDLLFATDRVKFAQGWATVDELTAQIGRAKEAVGRLGGG